MSKKIKYDFWGIPYETDVDESRIMKADKRDYKNIKEAIDKEPEPVVILDSMRSLVKIQKKEVNKKC